MFELLFDLANRVGLIIMLSFIFSNTNGFRSVLIKNRNLRLSEKLFMALFFGSLGILGTYTGIAFEGAIVNTRVIGVVVGGLLGGPLVGILAGAVAGIHRFGIDIGGVTAFACAVSTISEGLLAGYLHDQFTRSSNPVFFAWMTGTVAEIIQMAIIIILVRPMTFASDLVSKIGVPMIVMNAIGIAIFIAIVENIKKLQNSEAAFRAQQTLLIADETLQYLRQGLVSEAAIPVSEIISKKTDFKAVAITDKDKILAHSGIGENHSKVGQLISTDITKHVLKTGTYLITQDTEGISTIYDENDLRSAIIVPLKIETQTVGTLKLYKEKENSITLVDEQVAKGLGRLFSTQLEISRVDKEAELRTKAELKALQAQINPHFLFNAINTIVSMIRTDPGNARDLLVHLGEYFRNNMQINKEFIPMKEELKHIAAYLKIEKARFGDKLSIVHDIPDDLDYKIPPLLIQPLVENAIKHGIFPKEGPGVISIVIKDEEDLIIKVIDDGVGFSGACNNSIGLYNVEKRLETVYGKNYELKIHSVKDKGTEVMIKLPKMGVKRD